LSFWGFRVARESPTRFLLQRTATFMSLFRKRGENMSLLFQKENFKKTTTTAEISTTTTITTTTMKTPIEPVILF
jgi:hypothetical protein